MLTKITDTLRVDLSKVIYFDFDRNDGHFYLLEGRKNDIFKLTEEQATIFKEKLDEIEKLARRFY